MSQFNIESGPPSSKFNKFIKALGGLDIIVVGDCGGNKSSVGPIFTGGDEYEVDPRLRKMFDDLKEKEREKNGGVDDYDISFIGADEPSIQFDPPEQETNITEILYPGESREDILDLFVLNK